MGVEFSGRGFLIDILPAVYLNGAGKQRAWDVSQAPPPRFFTPTMAASPLGFSSLTNFRKIRRLEKCDPNLHVHNSDVSEEPQRKQRSNAADLDVFWTMGVFFETLDDLFSDMNQSSSYCAPCMHLHQSSPLRPPRAAATAHSNRRLRKHS